jgi:hypothetical protein
MNKHASKRNVSSAKRGGLSFKRETIRSLSESETKLVQGGRICLGSCHGETCPNSVCTITVDQTL